MKIILSFLISTFFYIQFIQAIDCNISIVNPEIHCNESEFSLLINYSGNTNDLSMELYINNDFVDYITESPYNWNDDENYFNSLQNGIHFIEVIAYNGGQPVCAGGKAIELISNCSEIIPFENDVVWCNAEPMFYPESQNGLCLDDEIIINTQVSAYFDQISLYVDNFFLGTEEIDQSFYLHPDEVLSLLWSENDYSILSELEPGVHTIYMFSYNTENGKTCESESDFFINECEQSEDGISVPESIDGYNLRISALLEANFDVKTEKMLNESFKKGLVPINQPFNNTEFKYYKNDKINENFDTDNIVDWMLVTLRNNEGIILEKKAVLVNTEGKLLDPNTFSEVINFKSPINGQYYVSIDHKTHLAIISNESYSSNATIDFTNNNISKGNYSSKAKHGKYFMYSGDLDNNNVINNLDYNIWAKNSSAVNTYGPNDIDGNGIVNNLDYNFWAINREKVGIPELLENPY